MAVSDWSTTASSNTTVGGINIAENCPPGNINNAIREMMAQLAVFSDDVPTTDNVQPKDATLTALAAITTAANKLIYATGADTFATTDLTAIARTLLAASTASAALGVLGGVGISAMSLGSPGYVRFSHSLAPSGIMIAWGSFAPSGNNYQTINYPAAFVSFSHPVVSNAGEPGNSNAQANGAGVVSAGTSSFQTWTAADSNSTAHWIAIGV